MFKIEKCRDKAVYSAKLDKPGRLDLKKIAWKFRTIQDTPIVLVIEVDGVEIIVHRHGELLFKDCTDMEKLKKIALKIYSA